MMCRPKYLSDQFLATIRAEISASCFLPTIRTEIRLLITFKGRSYRSRIICRCWSTLILIDIFHHFIGYVHSHHHASHIRSSAAALNLARSDAIRHRNLLIRLKITDHSMRSVFRNHILNFFRIVEAHNIESL